MTRAKGINMWHAKQHQILTRLCVSVLLLEATWGLGCCRGGTQFTMAFSSRLTEATEPGCIDDIDKQLKSETLLVIDGYAN